MATGRLPDPNSAPVTAKGDLYTYSTVPAKLAVGSNGETLVADSSATTGLRWQTVAQQNPIINSNFSVWQRGTSQAVTSTSTSFYGADRWQIFRGATGSTVSRQATGDTTNLPNIEYSMRLQRDSGNTSTAGIYAAYSMETADAIKFAGQPVVFTFYARRGANYSATSNALNIAGRSGTGTDQNLNAGYTGSADFIATGVTLTTNWQRFTTGGTVSSSATEIGFQFGFVPTGTAGANDWVEITGVQLEIGLTPTAYRPYSATLAGELQAAQRYYQRLTASDNAYQALSNWGSAISTTSVLAAIPLKATMRIKPSAVEISNLAVTADNGTVTAVTAASVSGASGADLAYIGFTSSGLTQFRPYFVLANNSTSAYLAVTAEL